MLGVCMGNRRSRHLGSEHGEMELYIDWKYEGMLWWWTVNRVYCFRGAHCLLGVDCSLAPKRQVENVHRLSCAVCRGNIRRGTLNRAHLPNRNSTSNRC